MLRPYQEEARASIHREWDEGRLRTLLVLPTGTGKTIVFAKIAEDIVRDGGRVLILAHRGELLEQAADKIKKSTGLLSAVEKAEDSCVGSWYRIVVGSVQTLYREKRLAQFDEDFFDAIIIDEAHHALSETYQRVLEHFPAARVLGVTATPDRGDKKKLGDYFNSIAYEYTLPKAIKEGYLCKIRAQTIPLSIDISGVGISGGDYKAGEVGTALDPYLEQIAQEMTQYCHGRKTVVFLPLIVTSQRFCLLLKQAGFRAAEVNGESIDRAEKLRDFEAGKYDVLCNSMLLTEGWDCPSVDCIVILRPTKIRSLYCQMVGRGTRISPGKDHLLLLDFLWLVERHELCRPAALVASNNDIADAMTDLINAAEGPMDIEEAEEMAEKNAVEERERALAERLKEMRSRKKKLVDPLQFEFSIQAEDLTNYIPMFSWEMMPPSNKQLETIKAFGVATESVECAGKASLLLDRLIKRSREGLSTPKQIRFLESRGFTHVGAWSFESANNMISRIANNRWYIPRGITPETYQPEGGTAVAKAE